LRQQGAHGLGGARLQNPTTLYDLSAVLFRDLLLPFEVTSVLILVALSNLGVNITALLAGLGVGGVAVALAGAGPAAAGAPGRQ
jgi:small-conductance mechanosensitive channel